MLALSIYIMTPKPSKKDELEVYKPKTCPPHKWEYREMKDQDGSTAGWKIVCQVCGPLKPSDGPGRTDI